MATTGWKAPGTAASVDRDGESGWSNPDNAKVDDANSAASLPLQSHYTDWLRLTNFGFTTGDIPSGSTIDGIEVAYKKQAGTANDIQDSAIYLRDSVGQQGDNEASAVFWDTSEETVTYGGAADDWNAGLSDSDVRAATFGVDLSALNTDASTSRWAYIYYCQIRIYYTLLPTVETDACTGVKSTAFDANGDIIVSGGATTRGFHYSKVFDNFEWGVDTDPLSDDGGAIDWTISAGGTSKVEIDTAQHYTGTRSARLYRDGTNTARAIFTQSPVTSTQVIGTHLRKDGDASIWLMHGDGTHRITLVVQADETIDYGDDGGYHEIGSIIAGTWFLLEVKNVDWVGATYDVYLDGVLIKSGADMVTNATYSGQIALANATGTNTEAWLDEIAAWDVEDEDGSFGAGEYSLGISGLDHSTTYYVQAFAKNAAGFGYGAVVSQLTKSATKRSSFFKMF